MRGLLAPLAAIATASAILILLAVSALRSGPIVTTAAPSAAATAASTAAAQFFAPTPSESTGPSASAAAPSILSDRFAFIWVEEPTGLRVTPESGTGGYTLTALPYSFNHCGCKASPDGQRIAYWTTRTTPDSIELRVLDLARPAQPTTIYAAPPGRRISAAAWSNDGSGILFSSEGTNPPGSPVGNPPNPSLLIVEASGGAARTLDSGAGVYVPLGWDRAAGIAAAAISGEGGYMTGYMTVRTRGDPAPKRTAVSESIYVLSVDASSDQRYALGVFFELGQSGGTLRWWNLADIATMTTGPRLDSPFGPKWRPGTAEIGWIAGGTLQLLDVERRMTRAGATLPARDYGLAAFRQDGSAVAATSGPVTVMLEIASGRTERIIGSGYIAEAVRLRSRDQY